VSGETATRVLWWEFFNPGRLWALLIVLALVIAYLAMLRLGRNVGVRYPNAGLVAAIMPQQRQWKRHVSVAMALCSLITLIGAWARPAGTSLVPRERATIVVVLDTSMSMQATDVAPNRLDAAREAARKFIGALPPQYNVAVVSLNGAPAAVVPPTTDRAAINQALDHLSVRDGTAIGDSLSLAVQQLSLAPEDPKHKGQPAPGLIVMLSDGANTVGSDPAVGVQAAQAQKVPVYTIAFGTLNGYVDLDGKRENVAPDTQLLRNIAAQTGGRELDAKNASQLNDVYKQITSEVGYDRVKTEVTAQWCLYALAFAIVAALGAVSMATRWP
jgi:Ca-activated chloride channel family protein